MTTPLIQLRREHVDAMVAHARETAPAECCGLIGGISETKAVTLYRLRNVGPHPESGYEAAPEDLFAAQRQMRDRGEELLAIYHSHPRAVDPNPSETDVRLAYYPSAKYLIIGLGGNNAVINAFSISEREQRWQQVEYEIADE
ncbi:MAG TPA: M67 family metallopeptidase [Pyrinomonadaceae bacterium]|nr:M67 family metallopeptidase [Pyrinomonadaceae bacterium]